MNKEIKQQWLAALRSGEYEQGTDQLRSMSDEFCCLGVLCDLHAKATGGQWELGEHEVNYSYDLDMEILPASVQMWAGLSENTGGMVQARNSISKREITALNDSGHTFEELADLIEEQL